MRWTLGFRTGWRFKLTAFVLLYAVGICLSYGRFVHGAGPANSASFSGTRLLVTLLRSPSVQADLKLDSSQTAAVASAVAEIDEPLWRLRETPEPQSTETVRALHRRLDTEVRAALRPEQLRRVEQLLWRAQGLSALKNAEFTDQLKLTAAQKEKIANTLDALDQSKPSADKVAQTEKEIMAMLGVAQQRSLTEILGPKFNFSGVRQVGVKAPEIVGIEGWINTQPIKLADLRGKVVVLHFWTSGCINCIHNLPVYKDWYRDLPRDKVAIVGIHTPETSVERQFAHLQQAVKERDLQFPIAMDLKGETWKAWSNSVWPAVYLIDRQGNVRYWWTGELRWQGAAGDKLMREHIEQLIAEKD